MDSRTPSPSVSIIVPVRNEAGSIEAALDACVAQEYVGELDIVVADAMSDDGTREILSEYSLSSVVSVVDNPERSTPAGLNIAIAASSGEIVVRCDAHSQLPPGYVTTAVATLQETGAVNVGGVQRAVGVTPVQRAIAAAMSNPFGVGDARFHVGGEAGFVDTVFLGVFQREAIEAVGGFDETLVRNQDYELNYRLRKSGGQIYFDPSLEVVYRPRARFGALWRQYLEYGRWKRVVVRRNPGSLRWRQVAAPLFVISLALSLAALMAGYPMVAAIVPVAYTVANALASVVEFVRRRDVAVLLTPIAFVVMHTSWGIGFLVPHRQRASDA